MALSIDQLAQLGLAPVDQASLKSTLRNWDDSERARMSQGQGSVPRTPNVAQQQMVMVPGPQMGSPYGQWVPAPSMSPGPEAQGGMQNYGYFGYNQAPVPMGFVNVQDQRSNQSRPQYPPPGQFDQKVQTQQDVIFGQLPPVPPFPVHPQHSQQAQQQLQQQQQHPAAQQQMQHQQQHPAAQQQQRQQQAHGMPNAASNGRQHQIPHFAESPLQQNADRPNSRNSLDVDDRANGHHIGGQMNGHQNGYQNGTPKKDSNSKRRNNKQKDANLSKMVEKVVEAANPPILTIGDLHSRVEKMQYAQNESPVSLAKLQQHLKASPERFAIKKSERASGSLVTLMKFSHMDDVKHLMIDPTDAAVAVAT